ncbi:indolepyruvate ferredoxin oxidoreductase alpha subunit [Natranaerovirga pectinivora]|uniref:Indolepyruvate oxidoreductase subunit IorA n=1 Tax=Natranaerovirga pectinivora TaxID=682400 RepID=A0A4V2V0L3_9FIRM|nr:indolepyruvate ferredoxin oxidoreductase subunit alpha [Natranaerovirga pectinivora]TCT16829.1 indolepyruvate ferredoxin oxidoreductase alpha subunit [Natranaerovirga pectinivora]
MSERILMLGNEAIARGAYEAGVTVTVAYPGTPSTEITENVAKYDEIYAEWAPNEKVALEVGIGSSIAGARTLVCMKHVGVNVAADPLFTVAYSGVNGGLVLVVADDPGMHSSQNEQDTKFFARAAHIPLLEPSSSMEAKEFVKKAFELSEAFDTPVIVRLTTRISHSQGIISLMDRQEMPLKNYEKDFQKYVMMPAMARKRHTIVEDRMNRLEVEASNLGINEVEYKNKKIGVITSGIPYQYVKDAVPEASVLKLGILHPLPKDLILEFCKNVEEVYVVEELEPIIEEQIKSWGINVKGKELFTKQGEYSANLIKKVIGKENVETRGPLPLPARPPVMCPGCPHRGVYYVLQKLKIHATGDIGCYTLGALPPLQGIDTCICMGASVSMVHGVEKARGKEFVKNWVGVIGDSTFVHSGITGLVNTVYNQGISTVLILDNRTTGMTGHQDHPGTGKTLKGEPTHTLDFELLCKSVGIKHVRSVDPFNLKEVESVIKEEVNREEPSVIIACAPCELLDKKTKRILSNINQDECKTCGICMKIGCPAIQKKQGVIQVNDALCNGCGLCIEVCAFDVINREKDSVVNY